MNLADLPTQDIVTLASIRNRRGRLQITGEPSPPLDDMIALTSRVVVIRCEYDYMMRRFEYSVVSPLLPVIEDGYEAPLYDAIITLHPDGTRSVKFVRVDGEGK